MRRAAAVAWAAAARASSSGLQRLAADAPPGAVPLLGGPFRKRGFRPPTWVVPVMDASGGRASVAAFGGAAAADAPRRPTPTPLASKFERFERGQGRRGPTPDQARFRRYLGGAALAGGGAVWLGSRETVPYTHRTHAIFTTPAMDAQLGEQTFAQVLASARAAGTLLPPYHPAVKSVERVGRRIAAVASDGAGGGNWGFMKGMDWEFAVIDDPTQVNAFVVPGGKVVVFTGLLRILRSEPELAAVLAHEVAHVLARHVAERITRMQAAGLLQMVLYWSLGIPVPAGAFELALFLPNSRKAETEADIIGMRLAARACYDPGAAMAVFTKLGQAEAAAGGPDVPTFLRTHPQSKARVQEIKRQLPAARELYEREGCRSPFSSVRQFTDALSGQ